MGAICRGRCGECGHEWDYDLRGWSVGSIDYQNRETYRSYTCPGCATFLHVPRMLDANSWNHWLAGSAKERRDSELLSLACARIAAILSCQRSRYVPTEIDIGPLQCLQCREPMLKGPIDNQPMDCPQCGRRAGRSLGIHSFYSAVQIMGEGPEPSDRSISPPEDPR